MTKKKEKRGVLLHFIGNNARSVTGSCIYGECDDDTKFLLELGGYQEGTILENYRRNCELISQIEFSEIDFIFINHSHIDHSMLIPVAVKKGFKGKIICTYETSKILQPLWLDCSHIMESDCEYLCKKKHIQVKPFYDETDIAKTLDYLCAFDIEREYKLTPNLSFKLKKNNHILGACQLELYYIEKSSRKLTILYTSDLGNDMVHKHYVSDMSYSKTANLVIMESTYGSCEKGNISKKDREIELKQMEQTIKNTLFNKHGSVLIPCFALDRMQNIVTYIYKMFKDNSKFDNVPVIMDGLLASRITQVYKEVLTGKDKEMFEEVLNWKNLRIITSFKDTISAISDNQPKICLSSSGFGSYGHCKEYIKRYVPHKKNTIVFVGYASPNSLSGRLMVEDKKHIRIDERNYKFNAEILALKTFSSHAPQSQIVEYIKKLNVDNSIILVHGDVKGREELIKKAKEELEKINKTTKLTNCQKNMKIRI